MLLLWNRNLSIPSYSRSHFLSACLFWPPLLSQLSASQMLTWKSSCYVVLQVESWGKVIHQVTRVPWVGQSIWLPPHLAVQPLDHRGGGCSCNIKALCCWCWQEQLWSDTRTLCNLCIITWSGWVEVVGSPPSQGLGYKEENRDERRASWSGLSLGLLICCHLLLPCFLVPVDF